MSLSVKMNAFYPEFIMDFQDKLEEYVYIATNVVRWLLKMNQT